MTAGYWAADWPGEDGGPRRLQAAAGPGLGLGTPGAELRVVASRVAPGSTMLVQRARGQLYLQGADFNGTAWVERVDPATLAPLERTPELPAGPWWPGGVAAHENGSLYVTQGRWCHRLDEHCAVQAGRELPRDRPYNSLVILADGHLAMKDLVMDGSARSELVVLEPDTLGIVARLELPEASIARLSAWGDTIYVVGDHSLFRVGWDGSGLQLDEGFTAAYRTLEGQTFGWDVVLTDEAAWFLDNGAGTEAFGGCFHGKTASTTPLHLVRVPLPGGGSASLHEVSGQPGGIIANPPLIEPGRGVALGYDSGHGRMTAWRVRDGQATEVLWQRTQDHASHLVVWPASGEVLTADYDLDRGIEQVVVLDLESGRELARVDTESPVQSVLFPCPGWAADAYTVTFSTVTRLQAGASADPT